MCKLRHGIAEPAVMRLCRSMPQHVVMLIWQASYPGQLLLPCFPTHAPVLMLYSVATSIDEWL